MNIYHRYLTQYMLRNSVTTVSKALAFCGNVSQGDIENRMHLKTLIDELNQEICKQCYKIVFMVCEVTNQDLIIWLNTKNDEMSKYQISYSALELEYFHAILQEILNNEDHRITFIVCINVTSTLTTHFSRESGQKVLDKWLTGGYYTKKGDFIYLGPRTILEFTAYLRSHCPNSICNLCFELVFTGRKCGHCYKLFHSYCLDTFLEKQNDCPTCKHNWNDAGTSGHYEAGNNLNGDRDDEMSIDEDDEHPESQMSQVLSINIERREINSDKTRRSRRIPESQYDDLSEARPSTRKRHR